MGKNLQKIKDMVDGTFKIKTQIGYIPEREEHEIGDKWFDSDGDQWEQMKGYRSKIGKLPNVGLGDKCLGCKKLIVKHIVCNNIIVIDQKY